MLHHACRAAIFAIPATLANQATFANIADLPISSVGSARTAGCRMGIIAPDAAFGRN
jgi:hypothetical protein